MDDARIAQLRDQYRARADTAYQNYQDSGDSRYYRTQRRAEDIADALQIALDAADDHNRTLDLRACLIALALKAQRIIDSAHGDPYDPVDVHDFLHTVTTEARVRGLIK
ncbi:MAG: hypothetical protein IIV15_04165 [Ruminococcus sp.]|nr:hypothetical protein [Ruminococcus sp.]